MILFFFKVTLSYITLNVVCLACPLCVNGFSGSSVCALDVHDVVGTIVQLQRDKKEKGEIYRHDEQGL